jgi:hypothetical protein
MRIARSLRRVLVAVALAAALTASTDAAPQTAAPTTLPLRLSAVAVNLSGLGQSGITPVDIVIERWSTDAEQQRLHDQLVERDSDALMRALTGLKPRAGYIKTTSSLGWDIQFAREFALPGGGRRIVIGTDRPMSFAERASNTRSSDYDFLLAEIRLTPDGKGTGKLFPAAKIRWDRDTHAVEVENWDTQPVRLQDIHLAK